MSASVAIRFNALTGDAEKAFTGLTRTVAGFEKAFAGVASSVQGHQERMNRAFEQFSGDKLLREANELARSIEKVGGASKLTAAEQQQVNRVVTEAIAKYQALGLTAPKAMIDLANATKQLEQPTQKASAFAGVLSSTFGQFTAANLAANAIQTVIGKLQEFVAQGQKLPGIEQSFGRLAAGIGVNAADMLQSMQTATRGMVSSLDLMQSANKAVLLGLPVTSEEMANLAKTATVLGKAMGLDATQSLNDLVTALGRSSPLILDNLGLTVKVGEANEAYALKLGKTADALTEAEKKTAFYEAAMAAAAKKTEELGEQTRTLGELATVAWNKFGDGATKAVALANVQIPKLLSDGNRLLEFLGLLAASGSPGAALGAQQTRDDSLSAAQAQVRAFQNQMERDLKFFSPTAMQDMLKAAQELRSQGLAPLTVEQERLILAFSKTGKSAQDIATRFSEYHATATITEAQIQRVIDKTKDGTKVNDQYRNSVKSLADQLSGASLQGEVKKLTDAFRTLTAEQRNTPDVFKRVADAALELFQNGAKLTPELFNIVIETGRLSDLLPPVKAGLDGTAGSFQDITGQVKAANAQLIEFNETMNSLKFIEGVPTQLPGFQIPTPSIPEPLPPTFWQEFLGVDGPSFTQATRFAADSAISALANAIQTGDWTTFKTSLRNTFADFAGSAIAAGVNLLVPGLGSLLQPLFASVADAFVGLFDRNRGRDLVEDFADSLGGFDALHRKLNELGDEGERLWIQLTQGVGRNNPEQARRAIEAVTTALEEQKRKQQEAGKAAEEAAKKVADSQNAAADVLRGRISELSSEYDRLFNSIKDEAPEEVMGIIEQQTRARMEAVREEQTETQNQLDALLKSLEDSFAGVGEAAQKAAQTIQDAFNGIRINPIQIGVPSTGPGTVEVPAMASGGIVRRPTLALVGESGPEAVVPLSSFSGTGGAPMTIVLEADGHAMAEIVVPYIPGVVRRYGLVPQ